MIKLCVILDLLILILLMGFNIVASLANAGQVVAQLITITQFHNQQQIQILL